MRTSGPFLSNGRKRAEVLSRHLQKLLCLGDLLEGFFRTDLGNVFVIAHMAHFHAVDQVTVQLFRYNPGVSKVFAEGGVDGRMLGESQAFSSKKASAT
jgi:hypothetical protein